MENADHYMYLKSTVHKKMGPLGEWMSIVLPILGVCGGLFLHVHNENVKLLERLDNTLYLIQVNQNEVHKRCDELHKQFYDLLKEFKDTKFP